MKTIHINASEIKPAFGVHLREDGHGVHLSKPIEDTQLISLWNFLLEQGVPVINSCDVSRFDLCDFANGVVNTIHSYGWNVLDAFRDTSAAVSYEILYDISVPTDQCFWNS